MKSVELVNVSFTYPNGFKAVENVSMVINKGENVAIIGQNGAGKTTTVKMMNGLLRPTEGAIFINGKNTKSFTTAQISKKVGYVFQNPGDQLFNKTVYDEIAFALRANKVGEKEIEKRVTEAAELCHVREFLDHNPYDLPFSLRKFVTIAIVVANNCDILVLDEPTAGQDLLEKKWLEEIIEKLNSDGKTIITITHDMDFVIRNFKRVLVMANKRLIKDGTPHEVFSDEETLKKANLKKPTISQLASILGLGNEITTIEEFMNKVGD